MTQVWIFSVAIIADSQKGGSDWLPDRWHGLEKSSSGYERSKSSKAKKQWHFDLGV